MTFKEVLTQVMHWLQQDKRLSSRALTRQLALDDDLDALQAQRIEVRHVAVEEDRRVLVWTGGAYATPSPPPASSSARQPATQQVLPSSATPPVAPLSSDAARRQRTVLFGDLVAPTALSGQRDPEDLCEVVGAYQDSCAKVIAHVDGPIAQSFGDGLFASFASPLAPEDAAQRAVRAGMGKAIGQRHTPLTQARRVPLAVRQGPHRTGGSGRRRGRDPAGAGGTG